ncbi:hypothetical protein [Desulfurivibrio dismutans]|nr:hypothetical protein [Desulfurivibrio alkaliphilus]MDF1614390.1 hypothetical protein [Desulfurivibrio alkaliphilus]
MTGLMQEFVAFCSLISESGHGCSCLTSPWILQEVLLSRYQQ